MISNYISQNSDNPDVAILWGIFTFLDFPVSFFAILIIETSNRVYENMIAFWYFLIVGGVWWYFFSGLICKTTSSLFFKKKSEDHV